MTKVNRTELQVSEDAVVMMINDDQFASERIRVDVELAQDVKRHGLLLTRPRARGFRYSRLIDGRLRTFNANAVLQEKVRNLYETSFLCGKVDVFSILIVNPS